MSRMSNSLHIIVNCTSRKSQQPLLKLDEIAEDTAKIRAKRWSKAVNEKINVESARLTKANQLYSGNYWSSVRGLKSDALRRGYKVELWIISAGFGLITDTDHLLPYSATFTPGNHDSVAGKTTDVNSSEAWWKELIELSFLNWRHPRSLESLIKKNPKDKFLVVVSSEYLKAIQFDLAHGLRYLAGTGDLVLISSKNARLSEEIRQRHIPTDARFLCGPDCALDCTNHLLGRSIRGSIGINLARRLVNLDGGIGDFSVAKYKELVSAALQKSPQLFLHKRTPMSDEEVKEFIRSELTAIPEASRTRLLRKLRDQGRACEQERFRRLYESKQDYL